MFFNNRQLVRYLQWTIAIVWIVFSLQAMFQFKDIHFSPDFSSYFFAQEPLASTADATHRQNEYRTEFLSIVIYKIFDHIFDRDILLAIQEATEKAKNIEYVVSVESMLNQNLSKSWDSTSNKAYQLSDRQLREFSQAILNQQASIPYLVSTQGEVAIVNLKLQIPKSNFTHLARNAINDAQQLADEIRNAHSEAYVRIVGNLMLMETFAATFSQELKTVVPFALILLMASISLIYQDIRVILSTVFFSLISSMGTLGIFSTFSIPLTPLSVLCLGTIIIISIMVSIIAYTERADTNNEPMRRTHSVTFQFSVLAPIVLLCLSASLGLLVASQLALSLANSLFISLFIGFGGLVLLSLTGIPLLLLRGELLPDHCQLLRGTFIQKRLPIVFKVARPLFMVLSLVPCVFLGLAFNVNPNFDLSNYFGPTAEYNRDLTYLDQQHMRFREVAYFAKPVPQDSSVAPLDANEIAIFLQWLGLQPEVVYAREITYDNPRASDNPNRSPTNNSVAKHQSLQTKTYFNQKNIPSDPRFLLSITNMHSAEYAHFFERVDQKLSKISDHKYSIGSDHSYFMDPPLSRFHTWSTIYGASLILIFSTLFSTIAFRSSIVALISLLTTLFTLSLTYMLVLLFLHEVQWTILFSLPMVMSIVLMIITYQLTRYRTSSNRYLGHTVAEIQAIQEQVTPTINSLLLSVLVGFILLVQSNFKIFSDIGLVVSLSALALLVTCNIVLPLLVYLFGNQPYEKL